MKVAIVTTSYDYEGFTIDECYLIPNKMNEAELQKRWHEETAIPYEGRNQHGTWKSTKYANHSIQFLDWMKANFRKVDWEQIG